MNDWMTQSYTQNAVPWQTVNQIVTPASPLPAIEYDYDTLGHISQIRDAINLQVGDHTVAGGRDPTQFFIANGGRGERDDPLGEGYAVYYDQWGHPSRFLDELGRETDQLADHLGRVLTTTYPEGDQEVFTYDVRNNALSRTISPKPGSAEATAGKTLHATMTYMEAPTVAQCANVATCNKAATSLSANGWTTTYNWNSNGTLASMLLPQDATTKRPETDYTYTTYGADGFSLLTGETQYIARTTPVVKTTTAYAYNAANHYVPQSVTLDPSGLNLTTTLGYDAQGDVTSSRGPRTDLDPTAYTAFFTYDADRRSIFAIQPDQDGAGPHPRVATLKTYDVAGHLLETDRGTTTATDGTGFAVNNWVKTGYDADYNKVLEITGMGSTTTTATQFGYDGANRVLCTVVRMNPVQYASLPSNACTLGPAGSFGPDRVTETIYDAAGQARQEVRGFGTAAQEVYATHDYEPDGQEVAVADLRCWHRHRILQS